MGPLPQKPPPAHPRPLQTPRTRAFSPWLNAALRWEVGSPGGLRTADERRISATLQTTRCGLPQSPWRNPSLHQSLKFPAASPKCGSGSQGGRPCCIPASKWRPLRATHGHKQGHKDDRGVCTQAGQRTSPHTQLGFYGDQTVA